MDVAPQQAPPRRRTRAAIGGLLALLACGWFATRVDWIELAEALSGVRLAWVAVAAALLLLEQVVRALRWRVLIRPLAPDVPLGTLWSATVAGAALNVLLPFRSGDLARPGLLAAASGMPVVTVLATTVVERLCDLLALGCIVVALLATWPLDAGSVLGPVRGAAVVAASAGVVVGTSALLLGTRVGVGPAHRIVDALPSALARPLHRLVEEAAAGLAPLGRPAAVAPALAWTAVIWTGGLLALVAIFRAFHLSLDLAGALFVDAALALSVALPQAPGFLGVFHVVVSEATVVQGASSGVAGALAVVFWAACFLPVTAVGLVEAARLGARIDRRSVLE